MFVLGKLFWLAADPANLLLLAATLGATLLFTRWHRAGRRCVAAAALSGLAVTLLPVGAWLVLPLESRFPPPVPLPPRVDGIVTLGGAVEQVVAAARGQVALTESAERLTAFVALARRYPEARLVYTGGSGRLLRRDLKETAVARMLFEEVGLDPARVQFEGESRNTYENARLALAAAAPRPGETWLLVTSAAHMPRAVGAFRRVGWPVVPYPVDYRTTGAIVAPGPLSFDGALEQVSAASREWVGLAAYRLLGRTDALFPGPRPAR
jgi:uncharacterized SAM-binding protein YcdF (DUF218 family)